MGTELDNLHEKVHEGDLLATYWVQAKLLKLHFQTHPFRDRIRKAEYKKYAELRQLSRGFRQNSMRRPGSAW